MNRYRVILTSAIIVFILLIGAGFLYRLPPERRPEFIPGIPGLDTPPEGGVELTFWGLYDNSSVYKSILEEFEKETGHIVEYKKFSDAQEYERKLLTSLTSGENPHIFTIHNTWIPRYQGRFSPLPKDLIKEYEDFKKVFGEFPRVASQPKKYYRPELFVDEVKRQFAPAVSTDLIQNGQILGLPFSLNSLVLFYNEDMLSKERLIGPPTTWNEFQTYTKELTETSPSGEIKRAGACIGTANNVNRSSDILAALIMQSGTKMVSEDKTRVLFAQNQTNPSGETFNPGARALRFYTDFADPTKEVYSWNKDQHYSIDAFAEEDCAMLINYSYQTPELENKNPELDFETAQLPQLEKGDRRIDYANYWAHTVNSQIDQEHKEAAWEFILFMQRKKYLMSYLYRTGHPTPRTDLVEWQKDQMSSILASISQVPTAQSWYQSDNEEIELILNKAIKKVNLETASVREAIHSAAERINRLMQ